ncbi:MAG: hypothetical protein EON60_02340 [Alphaproteobacteria bacterium]|nr:MAG: hypothetical protein EON60_02340 [Alphaproteobacteria bacterium]
MTFLMGRLELASKTQTGADWVRQEAGDLVFEPKAAEIMLNELQSSPRLQEALRMALKDWSQPEQGSEGFPRNTEQFLQNLHSVYGDVQGVDDKDGYTQSLIGHGYVQSLEELLGSGVAGGEDLPYWRLTVTWQNAAHAPAVWEWVVEPSYRMVTKPA